MSLTVYTKSNCVQCGAVKRWLDRKGVVYVEKNADLDYFRDEAMSYGFTQAPILVAENGEAASGFDVAFLERNFGA